MGNFELNFGMPLSKVATRDTSIQQTVEVVQQVDDTEKLLLEQAQTSSKIEQLLEAIQSQLLHLQNLLLAQNEAIKNSAIEYGTVVAKYVLQEDEEWVQTRIKNQVELALSQPMPNPPKVLLHPSSVQFLSDWLSEQDMQGISIEADPTLSEGECRFDWGTQGWVGLLDEQLKLVANRLRVQNEKATDA